MYEFIASGALAITGLTAVMALPIIGALITTVGEKYDPALRRVAIALYTIAAVSLVSLGLLAFGV